MKRVKGVITILLNFVVRATINRLLKGLHFNLIILLTTLSIIVGYLLYVDSGVLL